MDLSSSSDSEPSVDSTVSSPPLELLELSGSNDCFMSAMDNLVSSQLILRWAGVHQNNANGTQYQSPTFYYIMKVKAQLERTQIDGHNLTMEVEDTEFNINITTFSIVSRSSLSNPRRLQSSVNWLAEIFRSSIVILQITQTTCPWTISSLVTRFQTTYLRIHRIASHCITSICSFHHSSLAGSSLLLQCAETPTQTDPFNDQKVSASFVGCFGFLYLSLVFGMMPLVSVHDRLD